MKLGKVENKKALGIFEKKTKDDLENKEIVNFAAEYWINAILNSGKDQISVQMGNGSILLSEKELEKFKKAFISYISKIFPNGDDSISLWTSNGEYFERIGTDAYLREIMKNCNLPITCLPCDLSMWIYSDKIDVGDDYERETIYSLQDKKVK